MMTNLNDIENEITIEEVNGELAVCATASEYREFMLQVLQKKTLAGAVEDFHNLAVELSRKSLYELACRVLELGLSIEQYSTDVDLLADYLVYGIKCGKESQCEKYYELLSQIPKRRWKWRAFDFAVDYLQQKAERIVDDDELDKAVESMLEIARSYRHYFPKAEGGYVVEAQIHRFVNDFDKEEQILKEAVTNIKRAPQSNLRLADNAFARGEYELSRTYLQSAKMSGFGRQSRININYVYYLDVMCLISILQSKDSKEISATEINELYSLFAETEMLMTSEGSDDLYAVIEQQIHLFEKRTGYRYDSTNYEGNKDFPNFNHD